MIMSKIEYIIQIKNKGSDNFDDCFTYKKLVDAKEYLNIYKVRYNNSRLRIIKRETTIKEEVVDE